MKRRSACGADHCFVSLDSVWWKRNVHVHVTCRLRTMLYPMLHSHTRVLYMVCRVGRGSLALCGLSHLAANEYCRPRHITPYTIPHTTSHNTEVQIRVVRALVRFSR